MGKFSGLLVVVAEVALLTLPVAAQPAPTGPDQQLVGRLRELGQDQMAMARVGEARGVRADVRSVAGSLQRDQQVTDGRLVAYANRKHMDPAVIERPGDAMAHGTLVTAPLANTASAQFDYTFASRMVANHQAAIDAAAAAQRIARDPELRDLITDIMAQQSAQLVSAQELLAAIPTPPPQIPQPPGEPSVVSRTNTGADVPPAAALARPNR
jgi:uncharacterized protein (DUF305 family)